MRTTTLLLLAFVLTSPAAAGELAGVELVDTVQVEDHHLVLNGMAVRKKAIFKVYVAGLYLAEKERDPAAILAADSPRRMVLAFVRKVGGDKICDGWRDGLAANVPDASETVHQQFETLCRMMEDVQKEQRIVLTYLPGSGTRVELAAEAKGVIAGKPFADAVLSTWIGPEPGPGEEFKRGVLGE